MATSSISTEQLNRDGYLHIPVDPTVDLEQEIKRLKKEKKRRDPGTLLSGV